MGRRIGFLQDPEVEEVIDSAIIIVHKKEGQTRFTFTSCSSETTALKSIVGKSVSRIYRMYPDGHIEMLNIAMVEGKIKLKEVD